MPTKPTLKTSTKSKSSSTKAQNGSSKGSHIHAPSTPSQSPVRHRSHKTNPDKAGVVKRFVDDERDYKSYAVKDFDPHQMEAKRKHREVLYDVVGKRYV